MNIKQIVSDLIEIFTSLVKISILIAEAMVKSIFQLLLGAGVMILFLAIAKSIANGDYTGSVLFIPLLINPIPLWKWVSKKFKKQTPSPLEKERDYYKHLVRSLDLQIAITSPVTSDERREALFQELEKNQDHLLALGYGDNPPQVWS